jgi:hypothetical protein
MSFTIDNRPTLLARNLLFAGKKSKSKAPNQPVQTPAVWAVAPAGSQARPQGIPSQPGKPVSEAISPARSEASQSTDATPSVSPEQKAETPESKVLPDLDIIEKSELSESEYARQQALEEKAMFEAIGRRFAIPGRALNSAENHAKSWSRTVINKTKTIIHQTRQSVSKKTAATLRSWANALAPDQA